jgi:hypothetical protein
VPASVKFLPDLKGVQRHQQHVCTLHARWSRRVPYTNTGLYNTRIEYSPRHGNHACAA